MTATKRQTPHEETIDWLSDYIRGKHDSDIRFKDMKKPLKDQGRNTVYYHIFDNLYMLGSFVKEARRKPLK